MSIKFLEVKRAYYADPENVVVQWRQAGDIMWMDVIGEPCWDSDKEYRILPRTIRIGDIDVPEPVREELDSKTPYFIVGPHYDDHYMYDTWIGDNEDVRLMKSGLIHLTKEAAIEHAKALIIVSGGKV